MDSKPILRVLTWEPMPVVAVSLGSTLVLLGAALGLDAGLNSGALVVTGVALGCLGLLGMAYSGDESE